MKTIIAFLFGATSLFSYCTNKNVNSVTGQKQHVAITTQQEVALGLKALPEMSKKYGGIELNTVSDQRVDKIGLKLVNNSMAKKSSYKFDFHVLKDNKTINAFALPGGQVFITDALLKKLKTDGQIAGVLSHEIGHVIARHGAQQISKQNLTSGLIQAVSIGTYDPNKPNSRYVGEISSLVGSLLTVKFSRKDESESDNLGLKFMYDSSYDPHSMIEVMKVLEKSSKNYNLEFFSTHPNPENRINKIEKEIKKMYPNGIPQNFEK